MLGMVGSDGGRDRVGEPGVGGNVWVLGVEAVPAAVGEVVGVGGVADGRGDEIGEDLDDGGVPGAVGFHHHDEGCGAKVG